MKKTIMDVLNSNKYKGMNLEQLSILFSLNLNETKLLFDELVSTYVVYLEKGKYFSYERENLYVGKLDKKDAGFAFLLLTEQKDIHIKKRDMNQASDKDLVLVKMINTSRREGIVVEILKRDLEQ